MPSGPEHDLSSTLLLEIHCFRNHFGTISNGVLESTGMMLPSGSTHPSWRMVYGFYRNGGHPITKSEGIGLFHYPARSPAEENAKSREHKLVPSSYAKIPCSRRNCEPRTFKSAILGWVRAIVYSELVLSLFWPLRGSTDPTGWNVNVAREDRNTMLTRKQKLTQFLPTFQYCKGTFAYAAERAKQG